MTLTVGLMPDGPISSLAAARDYVRVHRRPGEDAVVRIGPGRYVMTRPLWLSARDSRTTFVASDPDEPPVFDGGLHLDTWSRTEVNGTDVWQAAAAGVTARSLFVNGARCQRPRFPREGYLEIAEQPGLDLRADWIETLYEGSADFHFGDGDAWTFHDLEQVDAVVPHYWTEERMPLIGIDPERRLARSSRRSIFALRDDVIERYAHYYWDNVFEALGEQPGEWYLDRQNDRVLYVPGDDDLASFAADLPRLSQFVVIHGGDEPARNIRFEGLVFRNADWQHPANPHPPFLIPQDDMLDHTVGYAAAPQAAANVDAAFEFVNVCDAAVVDCTVGRVGGYAVELGEGCEHVTIASNTFSDLGGGGVKLHGTADGAGAGANRYNTITDNEIAHGGQVFKQAVGILARHSAHNTFAHNEIHHLYYSGISTGWIWGYADNPSRGNLIEHNHIHHIGGGVLNDMGGIYVLGEQPGTEIRGNLIHDVEAANYGGWGIYLDEGSSYVVIEGNVCHDVSHQCFHQHYGRENLVRGNVFAFGRQGQVAITRVEDHLSLTLERNILVSDAVPAISGRAGRADVRNLRIIGDLNVIWDVGGAPLLAGNIRRGTSSGTAGSWSVDDPVGADEWMGLGHDRHSVVADPNLVDVHARRFQPAGTGPADELGITIPDVSGAGVRSHAPR